MGAFSDSLHGVDSSEHNQRAAYTKNRAEE
jgi:hypothetical protein